MGDPSKYDNPRVAADSRTDASAGTVRWSPSKSLWFMAMAGGWIVGGSLYFSWGAVLCWLVTCAVTLCFGHSLGMHRKFIHDSFDCPAWMEKTGVWLGTLVGLGGPFTMMYTHDVRDWAQRQPACHPFLCHQSGFLKDGWWQIHCKLHFDHPPNFVFPKKVSNSAFYRFIEGTSMLQQVPVGILLYVLGGWGFVFWGVCGRVMISILGHWFIGYFAHNTGHRDWHVQGAAVQGYNVKFCGLITFGECWHNNHHAFPGSAKLGLYRRQTDPGWTMLKLLERIGLVWNIREPRHLGARPELVQIERGVSHVTETVAPAFSKTHSS